MIRSNWRRARELSLILEMERQKVEMGRSAASSRVGRGKDNDYG